MINLTNMVKAVTGQAPAVVGPLEIKPFKVYDQFDKEFEEFEKVAASRGARAPAYHAREFILKSLETKHPLAHLLGLGEDQRKQFTIKHGGSVAESGHFKILYRFVRYRYDNAETVADQSKWRPMLDGTNEMTHCVATNKITLNKRIMRFTKYLTSIIKDQTWYRFTSRDDTARRILNQKELEDPNIFLARMMEIISNQERPVMVSTNPLDILLSSEKCGYTSCHSISSAHANGNIAYARDTHTAIVFVRDAGYNVYPYQKICRMWLYVDPATHKKFILGRAYGNITADQVADISKHISSNLAEVQGLADDWIATGAATMNTALLKGVGHRDNAHDRHPIYFDLAISRFVAHSSLGPRNGMPALTFRNAVCLCCSNETAYGASFSCRHCGATGGARYRCSDCGKSANEASYMLKDPSTTNNLCKPCYAKKYVSCGKCNVHIDLKNAGSYHPVKDGYACKACLEEHYALCSHRKSYHLKDQLATVYNRDCKKVLVSKEYADQYFASIEALKQWREQEKKKKEMQLERLLKSKEQLQTQLEDMIATEIHKLSLDYPEARRSWVELQRKFVSQ